MLSDRNSPHLSWTGLAMRVARYFPIIAVAAFIQEAALLPVACAWDGAVVDDKEATVATQPRERIADDSLQQAGFYDSRSRTNSIPAAPADPNWQRHDGALFHGQPLHFPTGFFNRP